MFGRKKPQSDGERTMVIGLNSGSGPADGLTLGDVRDFVYRAMTLGVPLSSPVSLSGNGRSTNLQGITVSTTEIPKPPDPSMLWPPTPAHGITLPTQPAPAPAPARAQNGAHNFHDGGVDTHHDD